MLRALKILLIIFATSIAATPLPRDRVEIVYSRSIYPEIQRRLTSVSNPSSFAWFDLIVGLSVVAALFAIAGLFARGKRGFIRSFVTMVINLGALASILYLWFLAVWGLNYQRQPLRSQLDYDDRRVTVEALRELANRDVAMLNQNYAEAHRVGWPPYEQTPAALGPAFAAAQRDLGITWNVVPGRPKRTLADLYFRRVSVEGMTDPFFLETLANSSLLPFERPFVVAHEWSHLAGFADESEANFVAWLICMRAPVPVQYSAWLSLYGTIVHALPQTDRDAIAHTLESGPRADLQAIVERIRQQQSPAASRASYAAYDKFLKANRVEAGIRSYDEVIRLLTGSRFTTEGKPVLRSQ